MVVVIAVIAMSAGLRTTVGIRGERIIVPTIGGRTVVGLAIRRVVILEMWTGGVIVVAAPIGRISVVVWELAGGVTVKLAITRETVVYAVGSRIVVPAIVRDSSVVWVKPMWDLITARSPSVAVAAVRKIKPVMVVWTVVVEMRVVGAKSRFPYFSNFCCLLYTSPSPRDS